MVTKPFSLLRVLTLTSALSATLVEGCTAPTGRESDSLRSAAAEGTPAQVLAVTGTPFAPNCPGASGAGGGPAVANPYDCAHEAGWSAADTLPPSYGGMITLWFDSSGAQVCGAAGSNWAHYEDTACDAHGWWLWVALLPAYQKPGVYSLSDLDVVGDSVGAACNPSHPSTDPSTLHYDQTSPFSGTLEILSSDANGIKVRLSNLGIGTQEIPQATGAYDVSRCQ